MIDVSALFDVSAFKCRNIKHHESHGFTATGAVFVSATEWMVNLPICPLKCPPLSPRPR
jgi:hypothetical protein